MTYPKPIQDWIDDLNSKLVTTSDGLDLINDLRAAKTANDVNAVCNKGFRYAGRWVRNSTRLWEEAVSSRLALAVRGYAHLNKVELIESGMITTGDESTDTVCDNRLEHPDNLSWVLLCIYAESLRG